MFKLNGKYTVYQIGGMAFTSCIRFTVKEVRPNGDIVFQPQGKRKLYLLPMQTKAYSSAPLKNFAGAVFEGWETPYTCDSDRTVTSGLIMKGNACFNFVGPADKIREWIETKQLNPNFEKERTVATDGGHDETVVYPELHQPGSHAVIDRILEKQQASVVPAIAAAA